MNRNTKIALGVGVGVAVIAYMWSSRSAVAAPAQQPMLPDYSGGGNGGDQGGNANWGYPTGLFDGGADTTFADFHNVSPNFSNGGQGSSATLIPVIAAPQVAGPLIYDPGLNQADKVDTSGPLTTSAPIATIAGPLTVAPAVVAAPFTPAPIVQPVVYPVITGPPSPFTDTAQTSTPSVSSSPFLSSDAVISGPLSPWFNPDPVYVPPADLPRFTSVWNDEPVYVPPAAAPVYDYIWNPDTGEIISWNVRPAAPPTQTLTFDYDHGWRPTPGVTLPTLTEIQDRPLGTPPLTDAQLLALSDASGYVRPPPPPPAPTPLIDLTTVAPQAPQVYLPGGQVGVAASFFGDTTPVTIAPAIATPSGSFNDVTLLPLPTGLVAPHPNLVRGLLTPDSGGSAAPLGVPASMIDFGSEPVYVPPAPLTAAPTPISFEPVYVPQSAASPAFNYVWNPDTGEIISGNPGAAPLLTAQATGTPPPLSATSSPTPFSATGDSGFGRGSQFEAL